LTCGIGLAVCRLGVGSDPSSRGRAGVRSGPDEVSRRSDGVGLQPPPRSPAISAAPLLAAGGGDAAYVPQRLQCVRDRKFEGWRPTAATAALLPAVWPSRTTASDWVRPFGFGGRMSAVAGTGRSGLGQAADRSTLELDVRDTPTCSRPNLPQLWPPSDCFQQARTGAADPLPTFAVLNRAPKRGRCATRSGAKPSFKASDDVRAPRATLPSLGAGRAGRVLPRSAEKCTPARCERAAQPCRAWSPAAWRSGPS
jgi:hypothetical protein